jgi:hypothetical protein
MPSDPEGNEKWLTRMLLLLPGFFSFVIARHLVNGEEIDDFSLVSYSLALSLLNFVLAIALYRILSLFVGIIRRKPGTDNLSVSRTLPTLSLSFMVTVLALSVILGIVIGYAYSSDLMLSGLRHGPFARKLTKRSVERPLSFLLGANRQGSLEEGRPNSMKQGQVWVEIHLKSGKVFAGYPEFFPLGQEKSEIFLSPACSVGAKPEPWPGPGVLIPEEEISYVGGIGMPQPLEKYRETKAGAS